MKRKLTKTRICVKMHINFVFNFVQRFIFPLNSWANNYTCSIAYRSVLHRRSQCNISSHYFGWGIGSLSFKSILFVIINQLLFGCVWRGTSAWKYLNLVSTRSCEISRWNSLQWELNLVWHLFCLFCVSFIDILTFDPMIEATWMH